MRQAIGWSCGIALLTIIGCAVTSRNPSTPSGQAPTPSPTDTTALGPTLQSGHVLEGTVAKYAFRIDPGSWTATSTLVEQRAAAANDDLYQLPIGGFLRNDSLRIDRIQADADSLYLTYTFEHPFSAPSNLDAPQPPKTGSISASPARSSSSSTPWIPPGTPSLMKPEVVADGSLPIPTW